jgi:hypothetical protein
MSPECAVIDLDQHEPAERSSITRGHLATRRKLILRLVAAFVAGVVFGGIGVGELRDLREERERTAAVALVAIPESAKSGGSSTQGSVELTGQLRLINAGHTPITIHTIQADRPGVLLRNVGQPRLLRPGGNVQILVELRFECSIAFQPEPVSIRFSVETDVKKIREVRYPIALVGSDWERDALPLCKLGG